MNKGLISFTQVLATRLVRLSHAYTWQLDSELPGLDPDKKYIFISNHQSRIDPPVIFAAMDLPLNIAASPVKFMTAKSIYYSVFRPLLYYVGCYPTYVKNGNIIDYSANLIKNGYSLFIFPEGRRTTRQQSSPKDGILRIVDQLEHNDVSYVLVQIQWSKPGRRRHAVIKFQHREKFTYTNPSSLMNDIYRL